MTDPRATFTADQSDAESREQASYQVNLRMAQAQVCDTEADAHLTRAKASLVSALGAFVTFTTFGAGLVGAWIGVAYIIHLIRS